MEYDVIIVGAGPAGISASLYTKRANKKILILYQDSSSLEKATKIENYYGFSKGISGKELYENGLKQAEELGVELKKEEVIKLEKNGEKFLVKTSKNEYYSKYVILATGNKKNKPKIKGIDKFEGRGISYCAICDGFFYRNKNVAVLGSGDYAISETNDLINVAKNITILTNGQKHVPEFRADNVKIETRGIKEIIGTDKVEEIKFDDNKTIQTDGIFVAQGVAGSADFAKKLGALTKNDKIVVNEKMQTNIAGLYACGDCIDGVLQVSKAVYDGMIAALDIIEQKMKKRY